MKIRIYHELNGTVRIVKVVEQGPEKGKESLKKPRLTSVARWCITKRKSKNTITFGCLLVNYKRITRGNSSGIRSEIKKYILTA